MFPLGLSLAPILPTQCPSFSLSLSDTHTYARVHVHTCVYFTFPIYPTLPQPFLLGLHSPTSTPPGIHVRKTNCGFFSQSTSCPF